MRKIILTILLLINSVFLFANEAEEIIKSLYEELKNSTQIIEQQNKDILTLISRVAEKEKEIQEHKELIQELKQSLENSNETIKSLKQRIEKDQEEINQLRNQITELKIIVKNTKPFFVGFHIAYPVGGGVLVGYQIRKLPIGFYSFISYIETPEVGIGITIRP